MPEMPMHARYEIDGPPEGELIDVGPHVGYQAIGETVPVRWVWRVAWLPRAEYAKMRADLSQEACQNLVAEGLEALYLDLDRADGSFMVPALDGLSIDAEGKDAPTLLASWPSPIESRRVGPNEESIMFAQRAFSLN